jgi:hypothetical protein
MPDLRVISEDDLKAEPGMFRPVIMIDSEYYRIGNDTPDYNIALLMCGLESRNIHPVQIFDDCGRSQLGQENLKRILSHPA